MTTPADMFTELAEDRSYQLHTSPDGRGGIRWHLMRYRRGDGDVLGWHQTATCTTVTLAADYYRDFALNWLRELGHEPDAMDIGLILPSVIERVRPDTR